MVIRMSLSFERLDEILKNEYGLESRSGTSGKYIRYNYYFKNRFIGHKRSQVFCDIIQLLNGGIGGYIYIDHLKEYNNHPDKTKMGHLAIGKMTEQELRDITTKVTKDYK